jgi:hypothetical protein
MIKETKMKRPKIAMALKIGGIVVGLFGLASLINNIMIFSTTLKQALEQGYPKEMVMEAIVPSQLLPGIFEPIALYGGLGLLMFAAGVVACKFLPQEEVVIEEEEEEVVEPVVVDPEF